MNNLNAVPAGDEKVKVSFYMDAEEFRCIKNAVQATGYPDKIFLKEADKLTETYNTLCGIIGRPIEDLAVDISNESIDLFHRSRDAGIREISKVFDKSSESHFSSNANSFSSFYRIKDEFTEIIDAFSIDMPEDKMVSEMIYSALKGYYPRHDSSSEKKEKVRSLMLDNCTANQLSKGLDKATKYITKENRCCEIEDLREFIKSIKDTEVQEKMEKMLEGSLEEYRPKSEVTDDLDLNDLNDLNDS